MPLEHAPQSTTPPHFVSVTLPQFAPSSAQVDGHWIAKLPSS
jgi:hypothetical protein